MNTITTLNTAVEITVDTLLSSAAEEQATVVRQTELLAICGGSATTIW